MDDTFSASDFTSAETSLSSEPAAETGSVSAEPSAPVDAAAQPGEATTQPAATETVSSPSTEPVKTGPIPFDVHTTALKNARTKEREAAMAEVEQQYGWAKQVNPQEFQQIQQLARTLSANPIEGLQQLIGEIRKDPQYDAALKSMAARALAQGRQQPIADQEPQIETIPVQLEDGRVVNFPTADSISKREAWIQRKAVEQSAQQFQPHLQMLQTLQQREQAMVQQQQIDSFVTTTYQDVTTWPGMASKENQQAVAQALSQARIDPHDPREVALALNAAYRRVVLPTLQTTERTAVLNDLNRQAAASTVNPAQTGVRAPKSWDEMTTAEALQHAAAQAGG